jgi:hypothetical protein
MESLSLSPSPAAAGAGPSPAAAGAGPSPAAGDYQFPPESSKVGPAGYMRWNAYRNGIVPPHSIERYAMEGDKGAALLTSATKKQIQTETEKLGTTADTIIPSLLDEIKFSREEYHNPGHEVVLSVAKIVEIFKYGDSAIPSDLQGNPDSPNTWKTDFILYFEKDSFGNTILTVKKRLHESAGIRQNVWDTWKVVGFGYIEPKLVVITHTGPMEVPDSIMRYVPKGGRRRRRTRRLTKALRYPRSGTRSRARRRVRG